MIVIENAFFMFFIIINVQLHAILEVLLVKYEKVVELYPLFLFSVKKTSSL